MNNIEQRLRAYIEQLEAEARQSSSVKVKRKNRVLPCFVFIGVLLSVLLFLRERK